jgi:segregation and condensation protein A
MTLASRAPVPIIQLESFEGPLDLLLNLVERRRLPIAELSLVAVADQYLAQVRAMSRVEPDVLSEFLAIGARLLLLKSRSLLPAIEPSHTAENDEEEDGADLVRRLAAYRAFRHVAEELGRLDALGPSSFSGGARPTDPAPEAAALQAIAPALLASLYEAIARRRAQTPTLTDSIPPRASVADRIGRLRALLAAEGQVSWQDVCGSTVDEIVATLLAVLELVRRGELIIVQSALFGPIHLEALNQPTVPLGGGATVGEAELAEQ